ncbi:chloroplast channel forming outer membrane protein [Genlisea aurea]|uniref:Chloroplast channel forming outer membrane protein n=1 Tax=Genlisea aurea TaxID=192259 RepID=S8DX28_9LAMI|nr:chloroplast channel forming outer membrane protein [Genlisea aurea]
METSLRYGGNSRSLRIHAKEKLPVSANSLLQVSDFTEDVDCCFSLIFQGELDTKIGAPTYLSAMIRYFYPNVSANFGLGVQSSKHGKIQYEFRGKSVFPVTADGMLNFTVKGRSSLDQNFKSAKHNGAAEFVWNIFNVKKDQDLRLKVGYDILDQIPYVQIRENNWSFNADWNQRWSIRYDL